MTIQLSWPMVAGICVALPLIGTILLMFGKNFFQTKSGCKLVHQAQSEEKAKEDQKVCKKVDDLKDQIKRLWEQTNSDKEEAIKKREESESRILKAIDANKDTVSGHYAEMQKFVGRVETFMENHDKNMARNAGTSQ